MPAKPLKLPLPEDIRAQLQARYLNQRSAWLSGEGTWPLSLPLGMPTEAHLASDSAAIRAWVTAWQSPGELGEVHWEDRSFPRLGQQRLPARISWAGPAAVAAALRERSRWERAVQRYAALRERFPAAQRLHRNFAELAGYSDEDFQRLQRLLDWLDSNRDSGLYLRQLPVEGLDTKWVEQHRALVLALMRGIRGIERGDFHEVTGLTPPPARIRMRLLCPHLRGIVGGAGDLELPVAQAASLPLRPARVLIVENLETGLALPDQAGTAAFMKMGIAVEPLSRLPWLTGLPVTYWGDIDTHGFVILSRVRGLLPQARSVLMDEATLLAHQAFWVEESAPSSAQVLTGLTAQEQDLYRGLKEGRWGRSRIRLEQERVSWPYALRHLGVALAPGPGITGG